MQLSHVQSQVNSTLSAKKYRMTEQIPQHEETLSQVTAEDVCSNLALLLNHPMTVPIADNRAQFSC